MLNSLYIKNFRLFKELKIKRLGRVNLFVGKNNSGKTCLLEALWVYANQATISVLQDIISQREEYWKTGTDFNSVSHSFSSSDQNPYRYLFYDYQSSRTSDDSHYIQIGTLEPTYQKLVFWVDSMSQVHFSNAYDEENIKPKNVQFLSTQQMNEQEIETLWNRIVFTPLEEVVAKGLRLVDTTILRVGLIRNSVYNNKVSIIPIVVCENATEPFPLRHLGEGMIRVFQIILALVNVRDGFLLIDEFENGLHYRVQPKMWAFIFKLARDLNVQVFATTHSLDCVTAFQQSSQESEDDVMLFRLGRSVRKSDNGKVIAIEYDKEDLQVITQAQMEVRG